MENYNQPSHREENRQSGTVPSWYNLNRPYNEHNRQQFPDMGNHLAFGEDDHDQQPGQSDRNKEERLAQRPAQYNAPDEDDLDDDDPDPVRQLGEKMRRTNLNRTYTAKLFEPEKRRL